MVIPSMDLSNAAYEYGSGCCVNPVLNCEAPAAGLKTLQEVTDESAVSPAERPIPVLKVSPMNARLEELFFSMSQMFT